MAAWGHWQGRVGFSGLLYSSLPCCQVINASPSVKLEQGKYLCPGVCVVSVHRDVCPEHGVGLLLSSAVQSPPLLPQLWELCFWFPLLPSPCKQSLERAKPPCCHSTDFKLFRGLACMCSTVFFNAFSSPDPWKSPFVNTMWWMPTHWFLLLSFCEFLGPHRPWVLKLHAMKCHDKLFKSYFVARSANC